MSKIICDICGTSYAETAKQCPICGSVRPGDVQRMTNEVKSDGNVSTGYTHVKGGRFSKSNVKKRNHTQSRNSGSTARKSSPNKQGAPEEKDNRGLVITAIVLLLAVIGVVIYIAVRFFAPISDPNPTENQIKVEIACTDIKLDVTELTFEESGAVRLLNVTLEPSNTSDTVKFRSENDAVVKVNSVGKVTVVGEGSTNIVITCGKITKKCPVTVVFNGTEGTENTGNTENTTGTQDPTVADGAIRLNRKDMTISQKGGTWNLYSGDVAKNLVTFTSEDESVVTFIDGVVTAVGSNYDGVWVHAEYNGQKASCLVRCSFKDSGVTGNGGVSEDGGGSGTASAKGTVTDGINVRSGPGTSYAALGTLITGDRVTILERKSGEDYDLGNEWGKINFNGGTGWVALGFVKMD